jgi:hypothetical protein
MQTCAYCKKSTKAGEPTNKVVVELRSRVYETVVPSQVRKRTPLSFLETVKEVVACNPCVEKHAKRIGNAIINSDLVDFEGRVLVS